MTEKNKKNLYLPSWIVEILDTEGSRTIFSFRDFVPAVHGIL